jgi:hypothetical protein
VSETNATPATPAHPGQGAPVFPPGRYGRRRDPRWRHSHRLQLILVGTALLAVVGIGAATAHALGQQYGPGRPYEATVERFYDITDEQVTVEFSVVVPDGEAAVCAVRARARDGAEVGREEVRVDSEPQEQRPRVTHTLATSERPVTGEVQRCWRAAG